MRARHPLSLAARLLCKLITVDPIDHDAILEYIERMGRQDLEAETATS